MRILLVEPAYRKKSAAMVRGDTNIPDDSLWYPPIGLMKISRYHKNRQDNVSFVAGIPDYEKKFSNDDQWDVIYIATVFTFYFKKVVETINYFKGKGHKIVVGGILATLMPTDIFVETGIHAIPGLLTSSSLIGFDDDVNIDKLTPDYTILFGTNYAVYDTFYSYTTRGCKVGCPWCAVPKLEPTYEPYIDIKDQITPLRRECGDYSSLKLMDNNILISPRLKDIISDLVELGYGRGEKTEGGKHRTVDFNQGVDATYINEETIELLSQINIVPLRIAFDRISEKKVYTKAVELAFLNGLFFYRTNVTVGKISLCKFIIDFGIHVGIESLFMKDIMKFTDSAFQTYIVGGIIKNAIFWPMECIIMFIVLSALLPVFRSFSLIDDQIMIKIKLF